MGGSKLSINYLLQSGPPYYVPVHDKMTTHNALSIGLLDHTKPGGHTSGPQVLSSSFKAATEDIEVGSVACDKARPKRLELPIF